MPKLVDTKQNKPQRTDKDPLRPFGFHGLRSFASKPDSKGNIVTDCPFCGREGKFSINDTTGFWQCFTCRTGTEKGGGNVWTFLRALWKLSMEATTSEEYAELAKQRSLLFPSTLVKWGVCKSVTTGDWLVPGFGVDGAINQLYRYIKDLKTGKKLLIPTPDLGHQVHGVNLYKADCKTVWIAEGPWDGMVWWEALGHLKETQDALMATANSEMSILAASSVIAVPGCGAVGEAFKKWLPLLTDKNVVMMFDSDHPRLHCKKCAKTWSKIEHKSCPQCRGPLVGPEVAPVGYEAAKRMTNIIARAEEPPTAVKLISWGEKGYDPNKPGGFDVRDALASGSTIASRASLVKGLLNRVTPIPGDWIAGRGEKAAKEGSTEMDCVYCNSWAELTTAWRKAMRWTEGLDRALSVMLACVTSTKAVGDQLWAKIVAPASAGKSTLCEALSVNKKYVFAKSTIRGFHSGHKTDKEGVEDHGLVPKIRDKTLITKDGDTLLKSPNLSQILSEARDLYDSTARIHYRHGVSRDHEGVRVTWILCGTNSIRQIDSSELGERFIDCVIMETIDPELEDEILWRVAHRASASMAYEVDGKMETQYDPDLVKAMQLTGGYVGYLRSNAQRLLSKVEMDNETLKQCIDLGKFVAYMRARPSKQHEETEEREFAARLVSQHVRLAKCLTVVLNRSKVDSEVMRRVRQVAKDTARGTTVEIAKALYRAGDVGAALGAIATWIGYTDDKARRMLRFLRRIGVVESFIKEGEATRIRWKLTRRLRELYAEITRLEESA